MLTRFAALSVLLLCAGCAAAPLGHVVSVPPGKTAEQAKADNQVCEDKASLNAPAAAGAADTAAMSDSSKSWMPSFGFHGTTDREQEIQRAVWITCMREAGYGVLPPGRDD